MKFNSPLITLLFSLFLLTTILSGCASSNVSRDAAANVDLGVENAKNLANGDGNIADRYQNSSQTAKGALIGGTVGGLTGALSSGIGVWPGLATGALLGASYGAYIDSQVNSRDKLINRGVNTVVLGDQVLLIIPSARLFRPYTAEIKPEAYSTLEMVAKYINRYTKILVKVSAFTNDTGSRRVDLALSDSQARTVAKVLLASGVDARLLYAGGYGGTRLVSKNTLDWDESDNYRIEISLEKLYV